MEWGKTSLLISDQCFRKLAYTKTNPMITVNLKDVSVTSTLLNKKCNLIFEQKHIKKAFQKLSEDWCNILGPFLKAYLLIPKKKSQWETKCYLKGFRCSNTVKDTFTCRYQFYINIIPFWGGNLLFYYYFIVVIVKRINRPLMQLIIIFSNFFSWFRIHSSITVGKLHYYIHES